jgi:SagB-type dehydrogenase family enzyme
MTIDRSGLRRSYRFSSEIVIVPSANGSLDMIVGSTGTRFNGVPALISAFVRLHGIGSFSASQFRAALPVAERPQSGALFRLLASVGILLPESSERTDQAPLYPWDNTGWGLAKLFHRSTVFTKFLQGDPEGWSTQLRHCEQIASVGAGPGIAKSYPSHLEQKLRNKPTVPHVNFFDVVTARRTCRDFESSGVNHRTLETLLYFAARAQSVHNDKYFGSQMLRSSPSGGSRHPIELYPQILNVAGMRNGSYYYHPVNHSLFRLGRASRPLLHRIGQRQRGTMGAPLAFIVTVRFARNLWKYRYGKSYLFSLLDLGHFVQTLITCAEALGLRSFLTPALDVALAHKHLRLPNIYDECASYLVFLGRSRKSN